MGMAFCLPEKHILLHKLCVSPEGMIEKLRAAARVKNAPGRQAAAGG
jgi:hypothetical protein